MRNAIFIITALIAGFALAFVTALPGSIEQFAFHTGMKDMNPDRKAVEEAVRSYNGISARFYATAGELGGLGEIPSAPLVKRRLFKDIGMLKGDGLVMVFDLDRMPFKNVKFHSLIEAEAVTDEVWAVTIQDINTRRPVFSVKAVEVQARYLLYKVPFAGGPEQWVVYDVDVYPMDMNVPSLEKDTVL